MVTGTPNHLYRMYSPTVIGLETTGAEGNVSMATAFHIGDGFLLTARHVLEGRTITDVVIHSHARMGAIHSVRYPSDYTVDLALLSSDFNLDDYMSDMVTIVGFSDKVDAIPIGGHLDDWLGDELVLDPVVLIGFPPIPTSKRAELIAVTGEINAVIDRYTARHVHFIVSAIPRGGLSGGPALFGDGILLGVLTESLTREIEHLEPGFAAVLSIEPIYILLAEHGVAPRAPRAMCYAFSDDRERVSIAGLMTAAEREAFDAWVDEPGTGEPTSVGRPSPPIVDEPPAWRRQPDDPWPWT